MFSGGIEKQHRAVMGQSRELFSQKSFTVYVHLGSKYASGRYW